jgi:hypothetical protein
MQKVIIRPFQDNSATGSSLSSYSQVGILYANRIIELNDPGNTKDDDPWTLGLKGCPHTPRSTVIQSSHLNHTSAAAAN